MAPEGIGGLGAGGERNFSSGMRAANYTLVCGVSLAGGVLLPRHTASRLMNVGNQAESKPFTFIFGVGISEYWIDGQRCGPLQRRHSGRPCRSRCGPSIPF